jgi:hypothetical protein
MGVAAVLLAVQPGRAHGQQQQQQQQEQQVDSTRLRALQRLQRLGRRLGSDSILFLQDSLRRVEAQENRGRGGGGSRDSTVASLLNMRGYAVTEYEGARADFNASERILVLQSDSATKAHVNREGMDVSADSSITYSEISKRIRTVGASTFTPPTGETVESQGLVYDMQGGIGSALGARTAYDQGGANWYVTGDMPLAAQDSSYMSHARFTSCDLTVPHYHFETDQIKIVGGKVLIARPVRLYFADVPVAWLPFIAQSLSRDRASGLLQPVFSVNDIVRNSTGYQRRLSNLGFYWAMSDYSDAIVAFDWFSGNYKALTGQLNYRWNRQFLNGNLGFRQYWRVDGRTEQALDTNHSWQMDERTQIRASARYITSTDFLQQNSFNPAEVTQSINSQGGINRRFDWGTMSVSANRQQYLSDNRVAQTLPSVNLNLSTITLFRAPQNRANFYNNMTWSGSAKFDRKTLTRDLAGGTVFDISQANSEDRTSGASSSLSLGNFSFSQSVNMREAITLGVPDAWLLPDSVQPDTVRVGDPARSINNQDLTWSTSINYQQHLIGSTTLTPSVSFSGHSIRSDTLMVTSGYVAEPARVSFSANLKSDIYGFWPGFAGFEAVRHKFSPSFQYEWAPEAQPNALQRQVFGGQVLQARNALSITINNTIEAKRTAPEDTTSVVTTTADSLAADSLAADSLAADSLAAARADEATFGPTATGEEPRRQERAQIFQLLGLSTRLVRYDFVDADSAGFFLAGFKTTSLANQITSDFLQGLSISMEHELWVDSVVIADGQRRLVDRRFSPHLAQLNLGFSLTPRSQLLRMLGFGGDGGSQRDEEEEEADTVNVPTYTSPSVDESSIIPSADGRRAQSRYDQRGFGGGNAWSANLSYSLRRPRKELAQASQMVTAALTLRPTAMWNMSWRTSYDLELHRFNDHSVRLTRDLHRWEANFDFLKTATGNWQFRFEVSLTDNRDLKFDYQQRNLDAGGFTRATSR